MCCGNLPLCLCHFNFLPVQVYLLELTCQPKSVVLYIKGTNESKAAEASTLEHEHGEQAGHEHESGEHAEEGEEAGAKISLDETYDEVRKGVRLILSFDNEISSFIGTLENVTEKTVSRVRVEVHLSSGIELGSTGPIDLAPGKKVNIGLSAEGQSCNWWKAHAEVGESEN